MFWILFETELSWTSVQRMKGKFGGFLLRIALLESKLFNYSTLRKKLLYLPLFIKSFKNYAIVFQLKIVSLSSSISLQLSLSLFVHFSLLKVRLSLSLSLHLVPSLLLCLFFSHKTLPLQEP